MRNKKFLFTAMIFAITFACYYLFASISSNENIIEIVAIEDDFYDKLKFNNIHNISFKGNLLQIPFDEQQLILINAFIKKNNQASKFLIRLNGAGVGLINSLPEVTVFTFVQENEASFLNEINKRGIFFTRWQRLVN